MAIFKGSRYQTTSTYNYYNKTTKFTPLFRRRKISDSLSNIKKTYKTYLWKTTDRIDILAYNEYGDSSLWWAILDANPQYMSPFDINVGDMLTLPPYESIREALGNGR